jgi:hypothetical protein
VPSRAGPEPLAWHAACYEFTDHLWGSNRSVHGAILWGLSTGQKLGKLLSLSMSPTDGSVPRAARRSIDTLSHFERSILLYAIEGVIAVGRERGS